MPCILLIYYAEHQLVFPSVSHDHDAPELNVCCLFQLLERPNDWGLDVFQLAEVVTPSRALGVTGFTIFKVQKRILRC